MSSGGFAVFVRVPGRLQGMPDWPAGVPRARFHANATIPDEHGCKTVGSGQVESRQLVAD